MKRLICMLVGHNWHEHTWATNRNQTYTSSAPFCICSRCGKTGWLV